MKRSAIAAAVGLLACGPSVKSVTVEPARVALGASGATAALRAVARDAEGKPVADPKAVPVWTSSAPLVAKVDGSGTVTALKSGEAVVTVAFGEAKGSARVVVQIPAAIEVVPAEVALAAGQVASLAAKVADDSGKAMAAEGLSWSSSSSRVAAVSEGRVVAVGPGRAVVTASLGGLRGEARVTVKPAGFTRLVVRPSRLALARGGATGKLEAVALDRRGRKVPGVAVTWRSSNEAVARVAPDGRVTAGKRGKARVTAAAAGKAASAQVTVRR